MDFNNLEKIEAFFAGKLSEAEAKLFEHRMNTDVDFAEEIRLFQLSKSVIRDHKRDLLLADADTYMKEFESRPTRRISFKRILSIAASLLLFIGLGFFVRQYFSQPSPDELFARHFELPKAPGVRGNTDSEILLKTAYQNYSSGNFEAAIAQFNEAATAGDSTSNAPAYYHLGLSCLMVDNHTDAIDAFQKVSPSSSYIQQAIWFEALTFLKKGNIDTTRKKLNGIIEYDGHYKKDQAMELLKSLQSK